MNKKIFLLLLSCFLFFAASANLYYILHEQRKYKERLNKIKVIINDYRKDLLIINEDIKQENERIEAKKRKEREKEYVIEKFGEDSEKNWNSFCNFFIFFKTLCKCVIWISFILIILTHSIKFYLKNYNRKANFFLKIQDKEILTKIFLNCSDDGIIPNFTLCVFASAFAFKIIAIPLLRLLFSIFFLLSIIIKHNFDNCFSDISLGKILKTNTYFFLKTNLGLINFLNIMILILLFVFVCFFGYYSIFNKKEYLEYIENDYKEKMDILTGTFETPYGIYKSIKEENKTEYEYEIKKTALEKTKTLNVIITKIFHLLNKLHIINIENEVEEEKSEILTYAVYSFYKVSYIRIKLFLLKSVIHIQQLQFLAQHYEKNIKKNKQKI